MKLVQIILDSSETRVSTVSWASSLMVPCYIATASFIILLVVLLKPIRKIPDYWLFTSRPPSDVEFEAPPVGQITIKKHGGWTILAFKLARLLGCLALFALSVMSLVTKRKPKNTRIHDQENSIPLCLTYLYMCILALMSISTTVRQSKWATLHLEIVLLAVLAVYTYRDLFPLATFTRIPVDVEEGWILWARIALLLVTGIIVPIFIPRMYVPVDEKNPSPAPEQTSSLIGLITFSFLDSFVLLANRHTDLEHDKIPPLLDTDAAAYLERRAFPYLDPLSSAGATVRTRRHIFWGLMHVFRWQYVTFACMHVLDAIAQFLTPIGINRLLNYLETNREESVIRPWFWITWIFVGPVLQCLSGEWFVYTANRAQIQAEGLLTQLVFEHSLRIRVKADMPSVSADEPPPQESLDAERQPSASPSSKNLVGKINNLVTNDLETIMEAREFLTVLVTIPIQTAFSITFLHNILDGWSAFAGLMTLLILFPLSGHVGKFVRRAQIQKMEKTDARVQTVTESMSVIRMIKLFGWERRVESKIYEKREEELAWLWKIKILGTINANLNFILPVVTMLVTFSTYTIIMKQELDASKVFSSMTVFDILREQLSNAFYYVPATMQGKVSLDRLDDFLHNTELLDSFSETEATIAPLAVNQDVIGFRDASFSWSKEMVTTPSERTFILKIADELLFHPGAITLIIGPTGSGKTSLLMALLGEMHFIPSSPVSWYNLPRGGGVAFAAQESWVLNETIRDNILFGSAYDEERYKKVVYQCCLEPDLEMFEAGDETEVGERGLTLSGGQKARVTLARAIYSSADILFLDDIFAALDVHTARFIIESCFSGELIRGRTVLLVTHNLAMVRPIAQFVVSLGLDGTILSQGSVSDVIAKFNTLAAEVITEQEVLTKAEAEMNPPTTKIKSDGKLTVEEEIHHGHISGAAWKLYWYGLGGNHIFIFFTAFVVGVLLVQVLNVFQTWFLGYWALQYEQRPDSDIPVLYYVAVYAGILSLTILTFSVSRLNFQSGTLRASRSIHRQLVESILGTTLRWLDVTPLGRITARCTQDIGTIDGSISPEFVSISEMTAGIFIRFVAIILLTPIFIIPGVFVFIFGCLAGNVFIKAQLPVKRYMSNSRSPVLGHFAASITGLTSIRAYGAQLAFKAESLTRIDQYTRAARTFYNLHGWVDVRVQSMGALFSTALAAYLVYGPQHTASDTGFSLNMSAAFAGTIIWWVRRVINFEIQGNSLERLQNYIDIEQEPKAREDGIPPAYWPASGDLRVENLLARYSTDGPKVLHDLSFHIRSGERVGIVGRTGSGKSSLTLALLRCIFTEGTVYYDSLPTTSLNLDALRSNITIIPQVPELLSGTLRDNLDPFAQYDDVTLNNALRAAGLFSLQSESEHGKITLDSSIGSAGSNFSVGQRQILALARALTRGSKLLILDEATSAIDYETDAVIQSSLRNELSKDVTVITVAHRLQTVMDADKIMVLNAGRIVEFDTPRELLKRKDGYLKSLVNQSKDRDMLHSMVR